MILWRISNYADLSGGGGLVAPGRWHKQGSPIVYCCDHPSTALLEILVHVDAEDLPLDFQLLKIHCPDEIAAQTSTSGDVDLLDTTETGQAGNAWLVENKFCLLKVPSAILPEAANILVNPEHADAGKLTIEKAVRYPFDSRLLK
ncbi:RES family NAD+ phosphorylase [Neorhizobium galegae]|uniref:RES family NAD+ phosphorylase n=1 Tax=Neorhizobium galegae TaxID=399 RepID=UPI002101E5DC|nr:RES family NAD+ phosphorylase [Neorhizobium galegae]MCQ1856172.1 RES family NAD+ phosphorylase [Neorhizobium galegae]